MQTDLKIVSQPPGNPAQLLARFLQDHAYPFFCPRRATSIPQVVPLTSSRATGFSFGSGTMSMSATIVNIDNHSGGEATVRETQTSGGVHIDVTIASAVDSAWHDGALIKPCRTFLSCAEKGHNP